MTFIILFLVLAFIALCNGDPSGFEAIGKVILYIVLFICIGCVIIYVPWLIVLVIVGVIACGIVSSKRNNSENHSTNNYSNSSQQQNKNYETQSVVTTEQTEFQRQLQENTKTPQQVEDENWLQEKEQIFNMAKNDFTDIKRELLDKAKSGQYSTMNGYKNISIDYSCLYLMNCIHREHYFNPTGKYGTSSYRTNKKVTYTIDKRKQYDFYLSTIKKFASEDNISINLFFVELDPVVYQKENRITLPYTYKHEWHTNSHKIKGYLRCSIQY